MEMPAKGPRRQARGRPGRLACLVVALLVAGCGSPATLTQPPASPASRTTASMVTPAALGTEAATPGSTPTPARPASAPASSVGPLAIAAGSALGSDHGGPFTATTKIPAFGQAVTWRFDGGPALAEAAVQILASDRDYPPDFRPVATVSADASGTAYYTTSFDRPAYLSVRAFVPAPAGQTASYSPSRIAVWRGTGPCPFQVSSPLDETVLTRAVVHAPGGATYTLRWGWDRAGNDQWTLVASDLPGGPAAGWRYVFTACQEVDSPVVGADGAVYVLTSGPGSKFTSTRLYTFGPTGRRAQQALRGLLGHLVRSSEGAVYLVASRETPRPGSSWAGVWHASYLAALDAGGRPKPGWPYTSAVPVSDPAFGADGTVYLATGFQIGLTQVPAAAQRVHTIVALRLDGTVVPGWPFTLPVGMSPTATATSEGEDMVFGQPPIVGADGTVYLVASKGNWGRDGDVVFALAKDGHLKPGWPYATTLDRGRFLGVGGVTGGAPGATPPAIGPDGTMYLVRRVGDLRTGHDEVVALAPDGRLRLGWLVALPDQGVLGTRPVPPPPASRRAAGSASPRTASSSSPSTPTDPTSRRRCV